MVRRFADWPKGLFDGAEALVAQLPEHLEVGVLSNTNALHWNGQRQHERVRALFTRTYLSYELGVVKPDLEIFAHVIDDLACEPAQILYFDDNQVNVDAARVAGIDATLARGPADCRVVLAARDVLA
jgi:putative hydrolase of the HAD superfamily